MNSELDNDNRVYIVIENMRDGFKQPSVFSSKKRANEFLERKKLSPEDPKLFWAQLDNPRMGDPISKKIF